MDSRTRLPMIVALILVTALLGTVGLAATPQQSGPVQVVTNPLASVPDAPAGTRWNAVTLALDTRGKLARASDLPAAIPGTRQVMRWAASVQAFELYTPGNAATDFPLQLGFPVFILLDETANPSFTLVGDVPATRTVRFTMAGGKPCRWNHISLPLEQGYVTDAQALAEAIRGTDERAVEQLLHWDAAIQNFVYWVPAPVGGATGLGTNFRTSIGHDVFVCLHKEITWPP